MKINYDHEADAMYIKLKSGEFDHNKKVDKYTIIDYDEKDNILGIEVLFVKECKILFNIKRTLKEIS